MLANDGSFEELYRAQYRSLVQLAYATTGSLGLAEELVQDAFVSLLGEQARVTYPSAWLRRAVLNRATSWVRRRRVERRVEHVRSTSDDIVESSVVEFLSQLRALTPRQRAAIYLRYHDLASESEIAAALECRPGTVKSLLARGLNELRKVYRHDEQA
jgi:RNA polymerase sigma factor (sigma-70 family)